MKQKLEQKLELAALGLGAVGWLCAILTRCLALWKVSGTVDNTTATLPAYWDGVWLEWDHWDLAHDGSLHCSFYRSLMSLSGSFRTWRALILAAIGAGAFASVIGTVGMVWFPQRGQIKVFSGSLFVLSGIILLLLIKILTLHDLQERLQLLLQPLGLFGWQHQPQPHVGSLDLHALLQLPNHLQGLKTTAHICLSRM
uniref:Claudin n=1 Tax=Neolamprologus brichardi TaxID=32507 RepID=A0A3Q4HFV5_NEOBR